jgi:PiT family inorganic phosphate transporter
MVVAWLVTLPAAAVAGAAAEAVSHAIGGTAGVIVILMILAALSGLIWMRSRATRVDHENVNAEWAGTVDPVRGPSAMAGAAPGQSAPDHPPGPGLPSQRPAHPSDTPTRTSQEE